MKYVVQAPFSEKDALKSLMPIPIVRITLLTLLPISRDRASVVLCASVK